MDENELELILDKLLLIPVEDECIEFKEATQYEPFVISKFSL
jgi:hypothetical protein